MNPLLPFLMAGDPSLDALPHLLSEAKALGLEAIELGLPHSDPIADGPVLQAAAHRAIARGRRPSKCWRPWRASATVRTSSCSPT